MADKKRRGKKKTKKSKQKKEYQGRMGNPRTGVMNRNAPREFPVREI
jgi:hypothetical protein